jgi:hypothetical protein
MRQPIPKYIKACVEKQIEGRLRCPCIVRTSYHMTNNSAKLTKLNLMQIVCPYLARQRTKQFMFLKNKRSTDILCGDA